MVRRVRRRRETQYATPKFKLFTPKELRGSLPCSLFRDIILQRLWRRKRFPCTEKRKKVCRFVERGAKTDVATFRMPKRDRRVPACVAGDAGSGLRRGNLGRADGGVFGVRGWLACLVAANLGSDHLIGSNNSSPIDGRYRFAFKFIFFYFILLCCILHIK